MDTSQYTELERVKLKIKALAAKTVDAGATEEEALAAMNVVGRLLTQYNLTMSELDVRDATYRTIHMKCGGRTKRHPIDHAIPALATLCGVKTWFHKRWSPHPVDGRQSTYAFFGQDKDLDLAEYLYKVMFAAMESEVAEFKTTDEYRYIDAIRRRPAGMRASAVISFQRGMASRFAQRLMELKAAHDAEIRRNATGSAGALITLKAALVDDRFNNDVGLKLRTVRTGYKISDYGAWRAGHAAGGKVNLSRPLPGGNGKVAGLLK